MTKDYKGPAAWTVTLVGLLAGIALANVLLKVPPVIPLMMETFNIGEGTAGWLSSIVSVAGIITALPASWLMRKFNAKTIGVVSLLCAAVGSLAGIFSDGNIAIMMVSRVIEGVGVGLIAVIVPSLITMWFPAEKRALPMGVWGTYQVVGQSLMFIVASVLTVSFGWEGVWWFTTIFAVVALIVYAWKVQEPPEGAPNYAEGEDDSIGLSSMVEGMKSGSLWIICLIGIMFTTCGTGIATFIAVYWGDAFFAGSFEDGNIYASIMYALEIVMSIILGWVLGHVKEEKRKFMGTIGMIVYSVCIFFAYRLDSFGLIIPFMIVYTLAECATPTTLWTICANAVKKPEYGTVAIAVLNIGLNAGTLLGGPLVGMMIETTGSYAMATIPSACLALISAVLFCFIKYYKHDVEI